MSVIATPDSAAEATPAAHGRTPAVRRDSFRLTALLTAIISVATTLNVLWWAFTDVHSFAPVLGSWLVLSFVLGLLSVAGSSRGGVRAVMLTTWLLQPLAIALVALVNTTYSPTIGLWAMIVAVATTLGTTLLAVLGYRTVPAAPVEKAATKFSDFKMLMKFRIISLLLLTTLVPMYMANGGEWPKFYLIALTLLGGTLAAGGANAINMYLDRDIDSVMSRTKRRPLPSNRLSGREVLGFGLLLSVLAFVVLLPVNLLTAVLAVSGIFYYVVIYTMWLKRSTVQNIVIGGAAGAIPPLVGWAAGANLNLLTASPIEWLPAIFLFAIVFYWTPPHFWALAIVRREDYARAGVPMLPVVRGEAETRRQILLYTFIMLAITLMLGALQVVGLFYLVSATVLGAIFLYYAVRMYHDHSHAAAWRLYKYSLLYLALLFVAMGVDRALA